MDIILSNQCESLTGSLGRGFGYFIVARWSRKDVKFHYCSQRSRWNVPPDGHLRFILACAQIAQSKLHIADIQIHWKELYDALYEARHFTAAFHVELNGRKAKKIFYNARDIINLKTTFSL